jgi:mercuric ion binding protein
MKKLFIPAFVTLMWIMPESAQAQKAVKLTIHVSAACSMCEERIEKAMDTKGVKVADYNLENGHLDLVYNPKKITEDQIHQLIANAGHDTDKVKASDEAYNSLHECCKYRENPGKKCEE